MSSKGWISLSRKIQDCFLWDDKPFSKGQAWIDLLLTANHKDKKFLFGNEVFLCERGSLVTSTRKLSEKWGWSRNKVCSFLDMLESESMLLQKKDSKKTVLSIVNYDVYQDIEKEKGTQEGHENDSEETQEGHMKDASRTRSDTNNNDNNVNNENNVNNDNNINNSVPKKTGHDSSNVNLPVDHSNNKVASNGKNIPPSLEEVKEYCDSRNNNVDPETWYDFYESKGWMVGKSKMKDWKAAVRTWERNRTPNSNPQRNYRQSSNGNTDDFLRGIIEEEMQKEHQQQEIVIDSEVIG